MLAERVNPNVSTLTMTPYYNYDSVLQLVTVIAEC